MGTRLHVTYITVKIWWYINNTRSCGLKLQHANHEATGFWKYKGVIIATELSETSLMYYDSTDDDVEIKFYFYEWP
jgi:hypothetical protein